MKKLVLSMILGVFVSGVAFGDIPPEPPVGKKFMPRTVQVQGLVNSKTSDKSTLVFVEESPGGGGRTVTKVLNNKPIGVQRYKFNRGRLFFVSADLLKQMGNNLNTIDYDTTQDGLSKVDIEFSNQYAESINIQSPIQRKTITYIVK